MRFIGNKDLGIKKPVYRQDAPPREWLDGSSYEADGVYYMKLRGKFYRFVSQKAFDSWSVSPTVLIYGPEDFPDTISGVLGFREGTLLNRFSDNTIHVVSGNKTRHVTNEEVLERYGLLGRPFYTVSEKEFNTHDVGGSIDE